MSQQYDNELRGVLFENDKGDNPNRPDFTGEATVNGQKYRMASWRKTSKNGKNFLSISLEAEGEPAAGANSADVPF
jgi:uncharacterized protein (DUF736 family)